MRTVNRALTDLEFALMHFQENTVFQRVDMQTHAAIEAAVLQAQRDGRGAEVADLGNLYVKCLN